MLAMLARLPCAHYRIDNHLDALQSPSGSFSILLSTRFYALGAVSARRPPAQPPRLPGCPRSGRRAPTRGLARVWSLARMQEVTPSTTAAWSPLAAAPPATATSRQMLRGGQVAAAILPRKQRMPPTCWARRSMFPGARGSRGTSCSCCSGRCCCAFCPLPAEITTALQSSAMYTALSAAATPLLGCAPAMHSVSSQPGYLAAEVLYLPS